MRDFRLKAYEHYESRPIPMWGANLAQIDFDDIHYFVRASERSERSWDDVPEDIKNTFDKLGIPEAERKFLSGVGAQYESESIYHQIAEDLEKQGVIFMDMDTALREHEDIVREYWATVIPPNDNKLAALNSAVWSGGSFVYVPKGVKVDMPLQAYFRINTENMGQFERTLIIAEDSADVHYIEGCGLAGSMVRVRDGEKPIEEIEAGDEVLTHRGRYRRVREPQRRRFVGPIHHIRLDNAPGLSLAVTPGHPFLVLRNTETTWLTAQELQHGDMLAIPSEATDAADFGPSRSTAAVRDQVQALPTHLTAKTPAAEDFEWIAISSIDKVEASCEVFNMSVEDDETYVMEGVVSHNCTAPVYSTDSLHSAVVEIVVKDNANVRYTTVQNWSTNVYNLVTKRAVAYENARMSWVDANLGCLTADAMVSTPDRGPIPINDIRAGDLVYGTDQSMDSVVRRVAATKENGIQPTFRITTENFRSVEATGNHPFLVLDRSKDDKAYTVRWRPLESIEEGDYVAISKGTVDIGISRFLGDFAYPHDSAGKPPRPIEIPLETNEDLMWLLGAYLGDGHIEKVKGRARRVTFSVPPEDRARARLERTLYSVFGIQGTQKGPVTLAISSSVLCELLLWLGFGGTAKQKRIPGWVFTLPAAQRLAFIEGYLDSDGYVRERKVEDGVTFGQIIWTSANHPLLEDLRALGIDCGLEPRKISTYSRNRKLPLGKERKVYTSHYLSMNTRGNLEALRSHDAPEPVVQFVKVASIEELPAQPTYDIEVEDVENFVANGVVVHNSKITMKFPSIYLLGERAHGEILSIAFAGKGQHQDAGGKIIHGAPKTTSSVFSKSISKDGGRGSFRGLLEVGKGATEARSKVVCDALLLDEHSRSDTYPTIRIDENDANVGHEASVSKVGEEQLFYLQAARHRRGGSLEDDRQRLHRAHHQGAADGVRRRDEPPDRVADGRQHWLAPPSQPGFRRGAAKAPL